MIPILQSVALLAFPILVIVGALRDVVSFTIPNWVSLALVAAFAPAALTAGLSPTGAGLHLAIGLLALVAGMAMFALGWIGGGDAKLFAAAGLWLGPAAVLPYVVYTAVAGGALALLLVSLRSGPARPLAMSGPAWVGRLATPGENVPYGVAIAFGALAAFPGAALMAAWGGPQAGL